MGPAFEWKERENVARECLISFSKRKNWMLCFLMHMQNDGKRKQSEALHGNLITIMHCRNFLLIYTSSQENRINKRKGNVVTKSISRVFFFLLAFFLLSVLFRMEKNEEATIRSNRIEHKWMIMMRGKTEEKSWRKIQPNKWLVERRPEYNKVMLMIVLTRLVDNPTTSEMSNGEMSFENYLSIWYDHFPSKKKARKNRNDEIISLSLSLHWWCQRNISNFSPFILLALLYSLIPCDFRLFCFAFGSVLCSAHFPTTLAQFSFCRSIRIVLPGSLFPLPEITWLDERAPDRVRERPSKVCFFRLLFHLSFLFRAVFISFLGFFSRRDFCVWFRSLLSFN